MIRKLLPILPTACCLLLAVNVYASEWQKPVLIDAGTGDAFRTSIAFDPYGNAMAVFEQYTDGFSRIYANQFLLNKGGWQRPVIIDVGPRNAYLSRVAFDRKGDAIAIFKQSDGNIYRIYANHFIRNRGWHGPIAIDAGMGDADGQQIIYDTNDNAVVVFEQKIKDTYRIFANQYRKGEGWQGAVMIDRDDRNGYFPYPAFDYQGNIYAIYYKEEGGGLEVYVNKYDRSKGIWGEPFRLTDGQTIVKREDWSKKRGYVNRGITGIYNPLFLPEIKKRIYAGNYTYNVKRFETPSKIDSRFRDAYTPSIVCDKNGQIFAFFVRWDGENLRGHSIVYKDSDGWGKPEIIDAKGGDVEHIRAAINSKGEIAMVFTQWVDGNLRIHARIKNSVSDSVSVREKNPITHTHTDTFSDWGKAEIIDAGRKDAYGPNVIYNGNDEIVVIWCQWEEKTVKTYRNDYIKERGWGNAVRAEMEDESCGGCGLRIAAAHDRRLIIIFEQKVSVKERTKIYAIEGR